MKVGPRDGMSVLIFFKTFFLEKYDPKYDKYKEGHTYTCHNQNPEKKILKIRS